MDHVLLKVKVPLPNSFKFVSPFPKLGFTDQDEASEPVRPQAKFVRDVTVPDGSTLRAGQRILKTWAIKNIGKDFWPRDTKLVFVSGQLSPVEEVQPLVPLAAPGEIVEVSLQLRMPDKPGRYTGYYRLSHGDGVRFGNRIWLDVAVSDSLLPDVKGVFDKAIEVVSKVFRGEKVGLQSEPEKQEQKGYRKAKYVSSFEK